MMEKDKAWEGSGECWREKALWRYLNRDLKELRALGQSRPGYGKSQSKGPEEEFVWPVGGTSRGPVCESGYSHVGPLGRGTEFTFYSV